MSRNAEGEGHQSHTSAFGLVSFEDFISPMLLEPVRMVRHAVEYFAEVKHPCRSGGSAEGQVQF